MGDVKLYMTVKEAAKLLGLSKSRLEQFIRGKPGKDGKPDIPPILTVAALVGAVRLVLRKDVEALRPRVRGVPGRPPSNGKPVRRQPPRRKQGKGQP